MRMAQMQTLPTRRIYNIPFGFGQIHSIIIPSVNISRQCVLLQSKSRVRYKCALTLLNVKLNDNFSNFCAPDAKTMTALRFLSYFDCGSSFVLSKFVECTVSLSDAEFVSLFGEVHSGWALFESTSP